MSSNPKSNPNVPAIPQPSAEVGSLYNTVVALKEAVEDMSGTRGGKYDRAATLQDLLDYGLVDTTVLTSPSGFASNVLGPSSSTIGDVSVFGNTSGSRLVDPAADTATRLSNRRGNYSATAGYQNGTTGGTTVGAGIIEVLGSSSVPDGSQDAVTILQKWSNSSTNYGAPNPTLYASLHMKNGSATSRGCAAFFETRQEVARVGDGNFIEGMRSQGVIAAGVAGCNVYGGLFVAAEEAGATHLHDMVAVEAEVINQTADAPYTPVNLDVLETAYLATSFWGTKKPLAAFLVSPFTPAVASWQIGFYVPPSALDDVGAPVVGAAFRSDAKCIWGLDLLGRVSTGGLGGAPTFGAIGIANNSPIRASNAAKTQTPNILALDVTDHLLVGFDVNVLSVILGTSGADVVSMGPLRITGTAGPTIRSGTGAATGTQPKGSLWLRTDGAVGSTIYVSQGGGTWNAAGGV
jgi:hypothetical protein